MARGPQGHRQHKHSIESIRLSMRI